MNKHIGLIAIAFTIGLFFPSCENEDEVTKPEIDLLELGIENGRVAYIGADLHIEAEIVAEGLIHEVEVEIHAEEGSGHEVEEVFDYSDQTLKNTLFHQHVDIPDEFSAGSYHFHLTVTDKEGNSTTVEEDITIEELADNEVPVITISSAPTSGQAFGNGETISVSGTIMDNMALEGLLVALVYEDDNLADADVAGSHSKVIVMLHTHDFDDPDETSFTASIEVGAANDNNMTPAPIGGDNEWKSGHYYILVKCEDVKLNGSFSTHYPIEINL